MYKGVSVVNLSVLFVFFNSEGSLIYIVFSGTQNLSSLAFSFEFLLFFEFSSIFIDITQILQKNYYFYKLDKI